MLKDEYGVINNSLKRIRKEHFEELLNDARLKDKHGHEWEIMKISFDREWTILTLGNTGTENYCAVMIANDGHLNELEEYEIFLEDISDE